MFNPTIGQWLEEDPVDFDAADPNLRRFVGNNPTNLVDPSGLQKKNPGWQVGVMEVGLLDDNRYSYSMRTRATDAGPGALPAGATRAWILNKGFSVGMK